MDIRELVLEALRTLEIDQAGLAKRLGRSQATVSRWVSGDATPDYESCLRLARIIGMPARRVLEAAGLDPQLVLDHDQAETTPRRPLDPRLAMLWAGIETGWRSMDERTRDVAERGTLALFAVPPAQRRPSARHDARSNRLKAKQRELEQGQAGPSFGAEDSEAPCYPRAGQLLLAASRPLASPIGA